MNVGYWPDELDLDEALKPRWEVHQRLPRIRSHPSKNTGQPKEHAQE